MLKQLLSLHHDRVLCVALLSIVKGLSENGGEAEETPEPAEETPEPAEESLTPEVTPESPAEALTPEVLAEAMANKRTVVFKELGKRMRFEDNEEDPEYLGPGERREETAKSPPVEVPHRRTFGELCYTCPVMYEAWLMEELSRRTKEDLHSTHAFIYELKTKGYLTTLVVSGVPPISFLVITRLLRQAWMKSCRSVCAVNKTLFRGGVLNTRDVEEAINLMEDKAKAGVDVVAKDFHELTRAMTKPPPDALQKILFAACILRSTRQGLMLNHPAVGSVAVAMRKCLPVITRILNAAPEKSMLMSTLTRLLNRHIHNSIVPVSWAVLLAHSLQTVDRYNIGENGELVKLVK